ncbi:aldehyde dehydrogenase family protein [Amycolatopsis kentuckyensis]|uniref:aldehyde dehydrogenase family protein n=1 Tax=Amycolatopsis kentuckyensis TaxID=218823 RepID=UPI00356B58D1
MTTTAAATAVPEHAGDLPVIGHYIGGRRVTTSGPATIPVHDPATGEPSAAVPVAGRTEVEEAIAVAAEAQRRWAEVPPHVRARTLFRFRDAIERNQDRLARIITAEHGKTVDDAAGEVQRGLEVVEFACGIPHLLKGENSPQVARGVDSFSLRQPLGVTAGITPFNFPVMVPLWMMPVSVACGNSFVLEPSEKDPPASLLLAELFSGSGGPRAR